VPTVDAHVRKGEQGTTVVFTKKLTLKEKDSEAEKRISMLRTYNPAREALYRRLERGYLTLSDLARPPN
jgi:antirestriction protein ArdC